MFKKVFMYTLTAFMLFAATDSALAKKKKKKKKKNKKEKVDKKTAKALKMWGSKKKKMDPMAFKQMYEEWQIHKGEKPALERRKEDLNSDVAALRKSLNTTRKSTIDAKNECEEKIAAVKKEHETTEVADNSEFDKGVVLKVQIGEFNESLDLPQIQGAEKDGDGAVKYTLGYFKVEDPADMDTYASTQQQAEILKNYLKKMGIQYVAVIKYIDSKRANIDEVAEVAE